MQQFLASLLAIGIVLLHIFLVSIIIAVLVTLLWNWVVPSIFSLPTITYGQAYGLTVLLQVLFGLTAKSK